MINKALYSSKSDEWPTPNAIFEELDREFDFNLDPCATEENHKCDRYFTKENDGLSQKWGGAGCFVIHPIRKLLSGLKRHSEKQGKITRLLCY